MGPQIKYETTRQHKFLAVDLITYSDSQGPRRTHKSNGYINIWAINITTRTQYKKQLDKETG